MTGKGTNFSLAGSPTVSMSSQRMKQGRAQIVAISLETAIQNGGIAFVVVNLTFDSPYLDMATIPILSMLFFATGPVMFLVYGGYLITRFDRVLIILTCDQHIDQSWFSRRILERCGYEVVAKEQPLPEPKGKGIMKENNLTQSQ